MSEDQGQGKGLRRKKRGHHGPPPLAGVDWPTRIYLFALVLMPLLVLGLPRMIHAIETLLYQSEVPVQLGVLQKVAYLNGFTVLTQLDTGTHSVLVRGATRLEVSTPLELRKGVWGMQVCEARGDRCDNVYWN